MIDHCLYETVMFSSVPDDFDGEVAFVLLALPARCEAVNCANHICGTSSEACELTRILDAFLDARTVL